MVGPWTLIWGICDIAFSLKWHEMHDAFQSLLFTHKKNPTNSHKLPMSKFIDSQMFIYAPMNIHLLVHIFATFIIIIIIIIIQHFI